MCSAHGTDNVRGAMGYKMATESKDLNGGMGWTETGS